MHLRTFLIYLISMPFENGYTPLQNACQHGHIAVVRLLLKEFDAAQDIYEENTKGRNAKDVSTDAIRRLIDHFESGADPDEITDEGELESRITNELRKTYLVTLTEYRITPHDRDCLGQGTFGTVYKVSYEGETLAVKVPSRNVSCLDAAKEVYMHSTLHHPNILKLRGYAVIRNKICGVYDFCSKGNLRRLLNMGDQVTFPWTKRLHYLLQAARAVKYLHNQEAAVLHRDLKPENLLIDEADDIKVADFGLSRFAPHPTSLLSQGVGTPQYTAPEIHSAEAHYDEKVDVFSFAMMVCELCSLRRPFKEYANSFQIHRAIVDGIRPSIPEGISGELVSLITQGWSHDPQERPSFSRIVSVLESLNR
eukprot:gb/GECG01005987.1/.p1 GENE.gb/GECG01005987.1/~~gb/GECG01005987.1/.p1  ORF type:complete len:366 (+),score=36.71 gb/GECG01005987.1/:1-1098(+)